MNYIRISSFLLVFIGLSLNLTGQKDITVEDIWQKYTFYPKSVPGFNFLNDGQHYTKLEKGTIKKYDFKTGAFVEDIFNASLASTEGFSGEMDEYIFNSDESKILIKNETEAIYRRSSRANYYLYDQKTKKLEPVYKEGKIRNVSFTEASDKLAFSFENNLYVKDLKTSKVMAITNDGEENKIINGTPDWVYEEEFGFDKAYEWSPDGKHLAFIRFDESEVPEFNMTLYNDDAYPEYVTWKYPKVGEKNAEVSAHVYNIEDGSTNQVEFGSGEWYIPRIKWTGHSLLTVFKMNRHQNELELLLFNPVSKRQSSLLKEQNKYYVDIHDNLTFLKDNKHFIWTAELDGYNHVYLYDLKGNIKQQLTKGNYDVTNFYGVDEKRKLVFYQAAEDGPLNKYVFSVDLKGKNKKRLTPEKGTNGASFSSTFDYFINNHSTINQAASFKVYDVNGKYIKTLEDNANNASLMEEFGVSPVEFFDFKTSEDVTLNAYMIKPPNFDANKKHPVFMYLYGGPNSQQVTNSWKGFNYWWFQMLAQKGYIVVCVDNRGTGGRGEEFRKMTYLKLGHYETIDQIEAAKYLGNLPYTDASRIGIFGWSYGGYMSTLCLLKGNDVFKAAIAVAPVTNWKWYDSVYTERYMRTTKENPDGYKENSPVYFADRLKGNYLMIHGIADDNVHFQNSVEMANALIKANKQFDTYFYPNRNHGIYGGNTRLHLYNKMTEFLLEKL